ncbi:hypothetical protein BJ988_005960 [Nocardioides panzhihuensis]|uniref:Uncharacterized protein n=1 Tax=Nocardioides panzhihuensis TaxID=860243 RepID=A0A7Z0DTN2_9ACTN|nr:hypothetical protein [Nocardioides panzhihuensis]
MTNNDKHVGRSGSPECRREDRAGRIRTGLAFANFVVGVGRLVLALTHFWHDS